MTIPVSLTISSFVKTTSLICHADSFISDEEMPFDSVADGCSSEGAALFRTDTKYIYPISYKFPMFPFSLYRFLKHFWVGMYGNIQNKGRIKIYFGFPQYLQLKETFLSLGLGFSSVELSYCSGVCIRNRHVSFKVQADSIKIPT